jgi:type VII secretion protein EccB
MASRRDLYQSHQSSVRRLVAGMVLREADPAQSPLRRMGGAVFGSVMVAVLTLAVAGVIGVVSPGGNTSWQESGAVVVEEETGARFVWLADADRVFSLHPVDNLATAALLVGTSETVQVSAASLSGVPRGTRLGIAGAPDSLPAADRLLDAPWSLCSTAPESGTGDVVPDTVLVVGRSTSSGDPVGSGAVLVRDVQDGTLHLVWQGRQYPVPQEDAVLEGLTLRLQPQVAVGTAWLNALPAGRALAPEPAAGRGTASAGLPGAVVGEVRVVSSADGEQYYQVTSAGIEEITAVQSALLLADPTIRDTVYVGRPPEALPLSAAEANAVPRTELGDPQPADPPVDPPSPADVDSSESAVCASFDGATGLPTVSAQAAVADTPSAAVTSGVSADGTVLADRVVVEPGRGAVVSARASATATDGGLFLVTDEGVRYAVPSTDVLADLGYGGVDPVPMPSSLVARLPAGPELDPDDAVLPSR